MRKVQSSEVDHVPAGRSPTCPPASQLSGAADSTLQGHAGARLCDRVRLMDSVGGCKSITAEPSSLQQVRAGGVLLRLLGKCWRSG